MEIFRISNQINGSTLYILQDSFWDLESSLRNQSLLCQIKTVLCHIHSRLSCGRSQKDKTHSFYCSSNVLTPFADLWLLCEREVKRDGGEKRYALDGGDLEAHGIPWLGKSLGNIIGYLPHFLFSGSLILTKFMFNHVTALLWFQIEHHVMRMLELYDVLSCWSVNAFFQNVVQGLISEKMAMRHLWSVETKTDFFFPPNKLDIQFRYENRMGSMTFNKDSEESSSRSPLTLIMVTIPLNTPRFFLWLNYWNIAAIRTRFRGSPFPFI